MLSDFKNHPAVKSVIDFYQDDQKRAQLWLGVSVLALLLLPLLPFSVLWKLPIILLGSIGVVVNGINLLYYNGTLSRLYKEDHQDDDIFNFRKNPEVSMDSFRSLFLRFGFIMSIALSILAFNWTTYDKKGQLQGKIADVADMQVEPPQTQHKKKKPPPPKVQKVKEVEDEELLEDEPEIKSTEATMDMAIDMPEPPEETKEPEIFRAVEEMPDQQGIYKYVHKNLSYPPMAKEQGIEGKVYVQFVVWKDGSIRDIKILRDIGGGCGDQVKRVLQNMPKVEPGKQRGKPVPVRMQLPIRFQLK